MLLPATLNRKCASGLRFEFSGFQDFGLLPCARPVLLLLFHPAQSGMGGRWLVCFLFVCECASQVIAVNCVGAKVRKKRRKLGNDFHTSLRRCST